MPRAAQAMAHPPTYLNKVLIGAKCGKMQLWNVRSQKCVYTFSGWGSAITVVEPSPAVDVVAVGLADGRIVLHNVLTDKRLFSVAHDAPVTALAFRTDGLPWLMSGDEKTLADERVSVRPRVGCGLSVSAGKVRVG